MASAALLSIAHGIPLSDEPGLGALTLPGYLRELTQRFAAREALVMHHPDGTIERWSYAELWQQAMQVARALTAGGVGKDSRVGIMMTNRPEWIAGFFGIGLAGGVAVAISTFSTPAELDYLLKASCVSTLIFEGQVLKKDFAAMLRGLAPQMTQAAAGSLALPKYPYLRRLVMVGDSVSGSTGGAIENWAGFLEHGNRIDPALIDATAKAVTPADAGALFFSSGSTGKPKGILSAHRGITIQCWRWRRLFALEDNVRCWTANGFFWSGNFIMSLGSTLSAGGALVLQTTFDPVEALNLMQAERVTYPAAWPHQWAQLEAAPTWANADLSRFYYAIAAARRHPSVLTTWPDTPWFYGNTETFTITTGFSSGTPAEIGLDSHGEVLPGCTIKIFDPLSGEVLPLGERGEIAVKGPTLMLGYIGIPLDETLDAEGFFHTGDGGRLDDKNRLFWEGRLNDIIKTGGANVSPLEVDAVLQNYPGVKMSQTVGVPHDSLGEMVVACIVPHAGMILDEVKIREFVKAQLASYKNPRKFLFVREDELLLTGSAKVKSSAVRDLAVKMLGPHD
jgi:acyl-CoA synthetase (AMP-forming)/AMP-acid ligase II